LPKASFAVWLQRELRRHGVSAFLDETSLRLGAAADVEMEAALRTCSIVVVVLTPDFLRSSYCMDELHWALDPHKPHRPLQQKFAKDDPGADVDAVSAAAGVQQPGQPCTVQRGGSKPPLLIPVFHQTSSITALQRQMAGQIAAAPEAEKARQFSEDLAAACRLNGDRPNSYGK
jgi:TIR domain